MTLQIYIIKIFKIVYVGICITRYGMIIKMLSEVYLRTGFQVIFDVLYIFMHLKIWLD